jgi:hypothetical protein
MSIIPEPTAEQAVKIILEWKRNPALQTEFRHDFGSFCAYKRAALAGLIDTANNQTA